MTTSSRTTSGFSSRAARTPSSPSPASPTTSMSSSRSRRSRRPVRTTAWSSTMRTRIVTAAALYRRRRLGRRPTRARDRATSQAGCVPVTASVRACDQGASHAGGSSGPPRRGAGGYRRGRRAPSRGGPGRAGPTPARAPRRRPSSTRQRGASSAACGSSPSSTIRRTTWKCPCGCIGPPITPNGPSSSPRSSSMPGMIVWNGPLGRCQRIRVTRHAAEAGRAVLEHDPCSRRDAHPSRTSRRRSGSATRPFRRRRPTQRYVVPPRGSSRRLSIAAVGPDERPPRGETALREEVGRQRAVVHDRTRVGERELHRLDLRSAAPARDRRRARAPAARRRPGRSAAARTPRPRGRGGEAARPTPTGVRAGRPRRARWPRRWRPRPRRE